MGIKLLIVVPANMLATAVEKSIFSICLAVKYHFRDSIPQFIVIKKNTKAKERKNCVEPSFSRISWIEASGAFNNLCPTKTKTRIKTKTFTIASKMLDE